MHVVLIEDAINYRTTKVVGLFEDAMQARSWAYNMYGPAIAFGGFNWRVVEVGTHGAA